MSSEDNDFRVISMSDAQSVFGLTALIEILLESLIVIGVTF